MAEINERELTIYCPAWGAAHLDMLARYALPSVMQPKNLPGCEYETVRVIGSAVGDPKPLEGLLLAGLARVSPEVQVLSFTNDAAALINGLRAAIRSCLIRKTRLLVMMPDTVIANGGILNMRRYAKGKPVCVAAPHLRANAASFLKDLDRLGGFPVGPKELFNLCEANPHQSMSESYSHRDHGTQQGGISLTRLDDRTTTIIHYLPTVYLAWFTESDATFFDQATSFREWDHDWTKHIWNGGRLRVFGSSELFFAAELTRPDMNHIAVSPGSKLEEHSENGLLSLKSFVGVLHG